MIIGETPQLHLKPLDRTRSPSAEDEAAALSEFKSCPRCVCARLSLQAYDKALEAQRVSDMPNGVFVDEALALRGVGRIIDGEAYLAFRGTVGVFLLSSNWRKVNLRAGWIGEPPRHRGFFNAWEALKPHVNDWLKEHRPTVLNITGHSMGAAVAQLAALELARAWPVERVILFAAPMVGAEDFNQIYDETQVPATARRLQQATVRYLLLSDAISLPLPRLMGYRPGLPIEVIDRNGLAAGRVPGLVEQALTQISLAHEPALIGRLPRNPLADDSGSTDLGEPNAIELTMSTFRMVAYSEGTWKGWLALLGLALGNALLRAVGFHSMKRYARAMGVWDDAPLERCRAEQSSAR